MKKIVLPITALLILAVGCSKTEGSRESDSDGVIRLRSGVRVATSAKAPIGSAETFTAQVCGWESATQADLATTPEWIATAQIRSDAVDANFDINPLNYYDKNGKTTFIRAWYPLGEPTDGKVLYNNPDGMIDVMLTQSVSGSLALPVSTSLVFEHLTTLLRFEIKGEGWNAEEKITGITLKGVSLPVGVDVKTGKLIEGDATDFALKGISAQGVAPQERTSQAICDAVMMVPTGDKALYVDVTTTVKKYENIAVTAHSDGTYSAGTAYTATLTFSGQAGITVGSTVGEWTQGTSGGEIVD